jgi:hypothetical protein
MIKLEMNHNQFAVIQEEIYSGITDRMCGNEKGHEDIYRKDFFSRVLPTVKIELSKEDYHNVFIYTMLLSEEDFITLYNEIMWSQYEGFGTILFDFYRNHVRELCRYLIKIKEEYNLKSTLDGFENLTWYMDDIGEEI